MADETKKLADEAPTDDNGRLRLNRMLLRDAMPAEFAYNDGLKTLSDKGAGNLSSIAFAFFLLGRVIGAALMGRKPAHKVLGTFGWVNVLVCALVIAKLGWISVAAVFASYFFMSIMFPTIFALGIAGLGTQSKKKASAFIVMSITGGALMPKLMGHLGDVYNMSAAFWVPFVCFILIGLYGMNWSKLSQIDDARGVKVSGGH
jgi:FHS family L-fucose permease-like MFS transporter